MLVQLLEESLGTEPEIELRGWVWEAGQVKVMVWQNHYDQHIDKINLFTNGWPNIYSICHTP